MRARSHPRPVVRGAQLAAREVRTVAWTLRALHEARARLKTGGLDLAREISDPPTSAGRRSVAADLVLRRMRFTCLERAIVLQKLEARRGRQRDVVIGVRGPVSCLSAHAWLDGELASTDASFQEIYRFGAARLDRSALRGARASTLHALGVDLVTAEVFDALTASGVDAVLLKGASFVLWLYADGGHRPYRDTDVLVKHGDLPSAHRVLRGLGFEPIRELEDRVFDVPALHQWRRSNSFVDLHSTLEGVQADSELVWRAFAAGQATEWVGGSRVRTPPLAARLLHTALHAAQHGSLKAKPLEDLRRALHLEDDRSWAEAIGLATELEARSALVAGLSLVPDGQRLLKRFNVEADLSVNDFLRAATGPPLAFGLERLTRLHGWRARGRLILQELVPHADFMRWWSPLARRGRVGLIGSYFYRWMYLLCGILPAYRTWRRARSSERARAESRSVE